MLVHGYNADELQNSVIISIPKDTRDNLNNSNNYRGIALGSALGKVIDHSIIGQYSENLKARTTNLPSKKVTQRAHH